MKAAAEQLADFRASQRAKGISDDETAKTLGIPRASMFDYITGRRKPDLATANRIKDASGIPLGAWPQFAEIYAALKEEVGE